MKCIDINCDMGELSGKDELLMPLISSCSIACGGHVGNKQSIRETIRLAKSYDKKIGAHPSYPDKLNFGRKSMALSLKDFQNEIKRQLEDFFEIAIHENVDIEHIKPHGALYHDLYRDKNLGFIFLEAVEYFSSDLTIFCEPHSQLNQIASENEFSIKTEGFADRKYTDEGRLLSRKEKDALIIDKESIEKQVLEIVLEQKVTSATNKQIPICVETICIHSDTPNALQSAQIINYVLQQNGIRIQ